MMTLFVVPFEYYSQLITIRLIGASFNKVIFPFMSFELDFL